MRNTPLPIAVPAPAALKLSAHHAGMKDAKATYGPYKVQMRVHCAECVWVLHEAKGVGEPPRSARVKRTSGGEWVPLCTGHAELWKKREGR